MTLLDPRAPVLFGAAVILGLSAYMAAKHPSPGKLSRAHQVVPMGDTSLFAECNECHSPLGLSRGCLSCHQEIQSQLDQSLGFHSTLLKKEDPLSACGRCHPEHHGENFPLTSSLSWQGRGPEYFAHNHVSFQLGGKHSTLECGQCHEKKLPKPFALAKFPALLRAKTFLGLEQGCNRCHEDVHAGGLSPACETCHGQESWRPAPLFDHTRFFPLVGVHERVACAKCHVLPDAANDRAATPLPFDKVKGKTCTECHPSPHNSSFTKDCVMCHAAEAPWAEGKKGMTAVTHALLGFRLEIPHDKVECARCHKPELPFAERYPNPALPAYSRSEESCQGCHADVHGGQFSPKYARCLDCHERVRFLPARFGLAEHKGRFALSGSHAAVPCRECHKAEADKPRVFSGTSRECKACHADLHRGQFSRELASGDCTACHKADSSTFEIRPYDHALLAGYALTGAHAKASCSDCHKPLPQPPSSGALADASAISLSGCKVYRGTSTECSACHLDVHRGQLKVGTEDRCGRCHVSTTSWQAVQFDHNRESRFALDGSHSKVPCSGCHRAVKLPDGAKLIQFKPLGTKCEDCHAFTK